MGSRRPQCGRRLLAPRRVDEDGRCVRVNSVTCPSSPKPRSRQQGAGRCGWIPRRSKASRGTTEATPETETRPAFARRSRGSVGAVAAADTAVPNVIFSCGKYYDLGRARAVGFCHKRKQNGKILSNYVSHLGLAYLFFYPLLPDAPLDLHEHPSLSRFLTSITVFTQNKTLSHLTRSGP